MMSARPVRLSITRLTYGNRTARWARRTKVAVSMPTGEYVDPDRPIGEDEIEIVAVQAAFTRQITAEIEGIVAGLKADEIVFAKRWNKTLVVR